MDKKRRERTDVKRLMCAILEILQNETDSEHTLSISEIRTRLTEGYDLEPDRGTVSKALESLMSYYRGYGKVVREGSPLKEDYTMGYRLERLFSDREMEMLINDVMFSQMRTAEQVREIVYKLKQLASPTLQKNLAYAELPPQHLNSVNPNVMKNLAFFQRVIAENYRGGEMGRACGFTFNGYGSDQKLYETAQYRDFFPVKIVFAYGRYYLIALPAKGGRPWTFRLDLITEPEKSETLSRKGENWETVEEMLHHADSLSRYLTEHLDMAYEKEGERVTPVWLTIQKIPGKEDASLTIVHDTFGTACEVWGEDRDTVTIRVESLPWGVANFVRRYMPRVRIHKNTAPEVKAKIEELLWQDFECYFGKENLAGYEKSEGTL